MKILLVGSGGREHALARKMLENKNVNKIFCAPGNGGTALENKCENVNITNIDDLLTFAKENNIDLTVVGPEASLIEGIVNKFKQYNLRIFGPSKEGALLEGSKVFSKEFMKKYGVKTAKYESFSDANLALEYLKEQEFPLVIKANGLAAGKGVYICNDLCQGEEAIRDIMIDDIFNGAGDSIIIEDFLQGVEASILSITDGKVIKEFISARDHKQIFDGNKGPNTGGMGVVAPNPFVTEDVLRDFKENIMDRTLEGIREEKMDFKGIIFFGVMITKKGTYLLEYNVRMGDPETQSVLPLMESDLVDLIMETLEGNLSSFNLSWKEGFCCNVVLASAGYPGKFEKGFEITIDKEVQNNIFIAGGQLNKEDKLFTSGGRVLSVFGFGKTLEEARNIAYSIIKKVDFKDKYFRQDIGVIT